MASTLIKGRSGVYGRQVTEKERKLLKQFASEYVAASSTRAADDDAALKRLKGKIQLVEGRPGAQIQGVRSKAAAGGNAKAQRAGAGLRRKATAGVKVPKAAPKRTAKAA